LHGALEIHAFMAAIAEWLSGRVAAAAKTELRAPRKTEHLTVLILNLKITLDTQRAIIPNDNFCGSHVLLRSYFRFEALQEQRSLDSAY
jgi:hypothetical protein